MNKQERDGSIISQLRQQIRELRADAIRNCEIANKLESENKKLKATMMLHAGDCCSLNNEVELFRSHWEDAEERCDELQAKLLLAMSQNYCKICGRILDGYIPPKESK